MNKHNVILHVGLPKTGSSFLQRNIFPKLMGCNVYGVFNKPFHIETELKKDKINIISNEQYSGRPNTVMCSAGGFEIANRFHRLFPDAKVIVVLRDKDTWMLSLYNEYLKSGRGTLFFNEWFEQIFDKTFDMGEYVFHLQSLFSDVLVLHFEDFLTNKKLFIEHVCDFINVPIPVYDDVVMNVRLDDKAVVRWRKFNRLFNSSYCSHNGLLPEWSNPLLYYLRFLQNKDRFRELIR